MREQAPQYPLSPYSEGFSYGLQDDCHKSEVHELLATREDFQAGQEAARLLSEPFEPLLEYLRETDDEHIIEEGFSKGAES